jgi:hypothetical protein
LGKIVFAQLPLTSSSPTAQPLNRWHCQFVGDAGIVNCKSGREDAVAADGMGMGGGGSSGDERAGKRARGQADTEKRHERKTSSPKECERARARGE